jgi:hypothetical protein
MKQDRPLTTPERDLLVHLLSLDPSTAPYCAQLDGVRVVSQCDCGCASIDLAVRGATRGPNSVAVPLVDAEARTPDGDGLGVLVFAADGYLTQLEVYAMGGDAASLPTPDALTWVAPPAAERGVGADGVRGEEAAPPLAVSSTTTLAPASPRSST